MARYALLYTNKRPGLDPVIQADTYRVDGKFFTFLKDKEVVRSLKVDYVVQIKRLSDEDDGDQSEEGDSAPSTKTVHAELAQHNAAGLDEL